MSVTVTWDNHERTVLRYEFAGAWLWEDFRKALDQAEKMLASVGHIVDVIADFEASGCVPTETLARLAYVAGNRPVNLGSNVIVGSKVFNTTTFTVFGNYYGDVARAYQMAHSLDRARALLAKTTLQYVPSEHFLSA